MPDLNRRTFVSLGAALGLASFLSPAQAWAWSPSGSVAGSGSGTDPQQVWDDTIDQLMAAVIDNGQVPAVNQAMSGWVNNNQPIPSGLSPDLTTFLQQNTALPPWADMTKLRRAAAFNARNDLYLFLLYGLGGGIMSTAIPREARAVYWSKGGADMQSRAAKTFTFGYDLGDLNAYEPTGQFLVTANKTRMVHAAVRHLLPQSPSWKAVSDEKVPITNGDILITFHSTGTFAHKKLHEWKVPISPADDAAFLHSWQVALHLLGVRDEYIPSSWADAEAQSAQVLTPILTMTPEGRSLAQVLLALPDKIDVVGVTNGFVHEFVRYLIGDQICDWLRLPRDYVSALTIKSGWPAYVAFRAGLLPVAPAGFYLFDEFVRALGMAFLNNGTSTTTTPITIPDVNRPGS
jgi:hypothetical protein